MPPIKCVSKMMPTSVRSRLLLLSICFWLLVVGGHGAASSPLTTIPALGAQIITPDNNAALPTSDHGIPPLTIHVGASIVMELAGIERVQVAEPTIADVVVIGQREIVINGLSAGQTTMHIWLADGRHTYNLLVVDPSTEPLEQLLTKAIGLPDVHVAQFRSTIILEGVVPNELLRQRAVAIARAYTTDVIDLLIVDTKDTEKPLPAPAVGEFPSDPVATLQTLKQALAEPSLTIYLLGQSLVIEGCLPTVVRKERAEKLASVLFPHITSLIIVALDKPQQIVLNVQVVETDKVDTTTSSVIWGTAGIDGFTPWTYIISQAVAGASPLVASLPISAKITGKSSIGSSTLLAAPSLLTLSGQEASFLAGGEIPVVIPSGDGNQIYWKEYGVKLRVLPTLHEDGDISVQVMPEVSTLDWANGVRINNILLPALKTRRAETHLRLQPGQTVVLGGLLQPSESAQIEKLPILGDLPIIGNLFRSQGFQKNRTELLIFVTPRVLEPGESATPTDVLTPSGQTMVEPNNN